MGERSDECDHRIEALKSEAEEEKTSQLRIQRKVRDEAAQLG